MKMIALSLAALGLVVAAAPANAAAYARVTVAAGPGYNAHQCAAARAAVRQDRIELRRFEAQGRWTAARHERRELARHEAELNRCERLAFHEDGGRRYR